MPLNIEYESIEEAQMRLQGTVVVYDGEPVYVSEVSVHEDGKFRVHLMDLPLQPRAIAVRKVINSAKLDLEPIRLGYVNMDDMDTYRAPLYVTRMPARKYKQGLSSANMVVSTKPAGEQDGRYGVPSFDQIIREQGFINMSKGIYPDVRECRDIIERSIKKKDTQVGRAVACDVSISKSALGLYFLEVKREVMGWSPDGVRFTIPEKFKYIRETVDQKGISLA